MLISAFVFATRIVQCLFYLNPKFQASRRLLCLYSPVCVRPVRKPHCWFSHEAAHLIRCHYIVSFIIYHRFDSIKIFRIRLILHTIVHFLKITAGVLRQTLIAVTCCNMPTGCSNKFDVYRDEVRQNIVL